MKSFNYRYLIYGLIVCGGAITSIYKQKDPYEKIKKEWNLTMSKENIKDYLKMDSVKFSDAKIAMFEKKCGANNENSTTFDSEEKDIAKISFLRRLNDKVKRENRALTADEVKNLMDSELRYLKLQKNVLCSFK